MAYRIKYFRNDVMMGDVGSNNPLSETREDAVKYMDLFKADYAQIEDDAGEIIERHKRTAK